MTLLPAPRALAPPIWYLCYMSPQEMELNGRKAVVCEEQTLRHSWPRSWTILQNLTSDYMPSCTPRKSNSIDGAGVFTI
jgi:hypothetical protein